ncbi:hypothetical protein PSE10B_46270 [Pseudomonas amygdali pv. eriobotryae]|nr:hypothetical protein PSE10B_46270 [Pseudomonas amygdali pv. eriobotryae]
MPNILAQAFPKAVSITIARIFTQPSSRTTEPARWRYRSRGVRYRFWVSLIGIVILGPDIV